MDVTNTVIFSPAGNGRLYKIYNTLDVPVTVFSTNGSAGFPVTIPPTGGVADNCVERVIPVGDCMTATNGVIIDDPDPNHELMVDALSVAAGPYEIGDTPQISQVFTNTGNQPIELTVEITHEAPPDPTPRLKCETMDIADPQNACFGFCHDAFEAGASSYQIDFRLVIGGQELDPGPSYSYASAPGQFVVCYDLTTRPWWPTVAKSGAAGVLGYYWTNNIVAFNPMPVDGAPGSTQCPPVNYDWN